MQEYHSRSVQAYIALGTFIESYEIMHNVMPVFRSAIFSVLRDLMEIHDRIVPIFSRTLPLAAPEPLSEQSPTLPIVQPQPASDEDIELAKDLVDEYLDKESELGGYLMDLRIEMQSVLLGSLFESNLRRREPKDEKIRVIRSDPGSIKELQKYFDARTESNSSH